MARYRSSWHSRLGGRTRNRIYIISALLIIAVVIAFICYYPFSKNKDELIDTDIEKGTIPSASKPAPEPLPYLIGDEPGLPAEPDPKAAELIDKAMVKINEKPAKIIEARDILNEVLPMQQSRQQRKVVKEQLSKLADEWLFSKKIFPQDKLCSTYKVKPGDLLSAIGKQHKVPWEVLKEINGIARAEALPAGGIIKVINGPFHTKIYRSTFTMDLYLQNTFVRSFSVGLGQPGMETPTGLWRVRPGGKLIKPTWTDHTGKTYHPEDPNYPLGSRWIGLEGTKGEAVGRTGFAIHGTKKPEEIGTAGSRGCIRLHNGDAILFYNLLVPTFSQVEVVE
jgi:hypothetical protein